MTRIVVTSLLSITISLTDMEASGPAGLTQTPISEETTPIPNPIPEITWDSLSKSTNLPATAKIAYLEFEGINNTTNNITIINVEKSCGCTKVDIDKNTIAPGEHVNIKTQITLSEMGGTQTKYITLFYKNHPAQRLTLNIILPQNFEIDRTNIDWAGTKDSQVATIRLVNTNVKFLGAESLSKNFTLVTQEVDTNKTYRFTITPTTTEPINSVVKIKLDVNTDGTHKPLSTYIHLSQETNEHGKEPVAIDPIPSPASTETTPPSPTTTLNPSPNKNNTARKEEIAEELKQLYKREGELLKELNQSK